MFKLIGILVLFVGAVQAKRGRKHRNGDYNAALPMQQYDPRFCNHTHLINASLCVTLPVVFSPEMFIQCKDEAAAAKNADKVSARNGRSRNGNNQMFPNFRMAALLRTNRLSNGRGGCFNPFCAAACVMTKTNHLLQNGTIALDKLEESYVNNATDPWKPVAKLAVSECWQNLSSRLAALDAEPGPKGVPSKCSKGPLFMVTCIQRYLFLNAPEGQSINLVPSDDPATCEVRKRNLTACDYAFMPAFQGGHGGKWRNKMRGFRRRLPGFNGWKNEGERRNPNAEDLEPQ